MALQTTLGRAAPISRRDTQGDWMSRTKQERWMVFKLVGLAGGGFTLLVGAFAGWGTKLAASGAQESGGFMGIMERTAPNVVLGLVGMWMLFRLLQRVLDRQDVDYDRVSSLIEEAIRKVLNE